MAEIHFDIVDGARGRFGPGGWEFERIVTVSGLTGEDASHRMYEAFQHGQMPPYFAGHPIAPGIYALDFNASALQPGIVQVAITYRAPLAAELPPDESAAAQIEIGTTLVGARRWKDVNGDQMIVSHKPIINGEPGAEVIQPAPVDVQDAVSIIRAVRREPNHPGQKSAANVGHMNSAEFAGDPTKWWLCTALVGVSQDGGQSYEVRYEFQRNVETWDAVTVYVDPETNQILVNPVEGESLREYQVYELADFAGLSLGI